MGRVVDRELNSAIGRRLRLLRERIGISRQEIASELGVVWQQVQKYENGTNAISIVAMRRMAELFGVSPCDICQCCRHKMRI